MLTGFLSPDGLMVPFDRLEAEAHRFNMPTALLLGLARQKRKYAAITATELVGPPQIRALKSRHDYACDPADQIWAALGSGVHKMLELKAEANALTEERLTKEFEVQIGDQVRRVMLGGTSDHYAGRVLTNYKTCSVWKSIKWHEDGPSPEWVATEQVYAYLWREHGFEVTTLQICMIFKDWSESDRDRTLGSYHCTVCTKKKGYTSRHERSSRPGIEHAQFEDKSKAGWYPKAQWETVELPLWEHSETERYIMDRLKIHLETESLSDESLPQCTAQEHWNGRRCARWCEVAPFCRQRAEAMRVHGAVDRMKANGNGVH